jgi:hypothetical protein
MRAALVQALSPLTATILVLGGIFILGDQAELALQRQAGVEEIQAPLTIRAEPLPPIVNSAAPAPTVSVQPPHFRSEARVVGLLLPHHGKAPVTGLDFSRSPSPADETAK